MNQKILKTGYWSAMIAGAATLAFFTVQILQLLRLLPYPWDEVSIYGTSLCITIPLLLAMLALHYSTAPEKRFYSHAALLFTIIYVVFVIANYVVQLATVIPMTLRGEAGHISLLVQTPHSLFWDYDAIGYIFMGLATFVAIPVFAMKGFDKKVRLVFLLHALVTPLIAVVYFYPVYSETLLLLGLPWGFTAPAFMFFLSVRFRKQMNILPGISDQLLEE